MKDAHGEEKYSNGSMSLGSKLAMLVEWKQSRRQVLFLPFSKEKALRTRVQWNRCSCKQTLETVPTILAICEVTPETGSDYCLELHYGTVLGDKFCVSFLGILVIAPSRNYMRGMGKTFQHNDFWDRVVGQALLMTG